MNLFLKESDKDGKYGYSNVLKKAKKLGGSLVKSTTAFSTSLISGFNEKDYTINVKARFNEDNFSAELKKKLDDFKNIIVSPSITSLYK